MAHLNHQAPFTEEQLVVMALASNDEPMTPKAIHTWICRKFHFYLNLALDTMWTEKPIMGPPLTNPTDGDTFHFQHNFEEAFQQFQVPLVCLKEGYFKEGYFKEGYCKEGYFKEGYCKEGYLLHGESEWKVSKAEARVFLQPMMQPTENNKKQSFPLLRLPAELRLRIYEMVLSFPRAGLLVQYEEDFPVENDDSGTVSRLPPGGAKMFALSLDLNEPEAVEELYIPGTHWWHYREENMIQCGSSAAILTLLLVYKQLYQEALPVFYCINKFTTVTFGGMVNFLTKTPEVRRNQIRHLSFGLNSNYGLRSVSQIKRGIDVLLDCDKLAEIDIHFSEHWWEPRKACFMVAKFLVAELFNMAGSKTIRFHGHCPAIKQCLEQRKNELEQPEQAGDFEGSALDVLWLM